MRKVLENKSKKKFDLNLTFTKKRVAILILMIIVFAVSIPIIMFGFVPRKVDMKDLLLYSCNITKNLDYKINLYSNSFIEQEYLGKGETYISDLVKNIDATFNYSLNGSKKSDMSYTYGIVATINGQYQASSDSNSTSVWTKDYVILEEKTIDKENVSSININENAAIDFNFFNNEVSEFRKKLKLPITANLYVKMMVKSNVKTIENEGSNVDESSIEMVIPLNKQAFEIKEEYKKNDAKTVLSEYDKKYNIPIIVLGLLLAISDLVSFMIFYKKLFNIEDRSEYKATLDRILKNYGDVVVEIVKPVKTKITGVIDVKSFNEMIDLEEELRIPILFHEIPGRSEGWFTLIHGETLYRYVLKDEENEAKKDEKKENVAVDEKLNSTEDEQNGRRRRK